MADDLDYGATIKGFNPGQKVFNRYTLKKILGRGGMGVVWLATDEELGRETALKFLPEVVAMDPSAIGDLKREVRRAIELAHPHIVKIHDFVTDGRTAAVSMEYVTGQTLSSHRLDEPGQVFTPEKLGPWVAQLCSALDYAHHDAEVVHRDLKPTNLMIDGRGRLKVLDFGIAASISDSVSRVSNKGSSSGTPVYMSPQQMMGEDAAITDDVYALGATLFELLAGKPPFHAGNIVLQVQNKAAPLLNDRCKTLGLAPVPGEWEQGIAACLAKDPKDRPQSAGEVAERLGLGGAKGNAQRSTLNVQRSKPVGASLVDARKVERVSAAIALATAAAPNALSDARPNGLGASRSTSKTPLYAALAAGVIALAGLGWYFGIHAPEQKRLAEVLRYFGIQPGQPWENTLGQKFVPVPGTGVLFCIWETRVEDFEAFVRETGHDATEEMFSDRGAGQKEQGDTWKSPGFPQGPTHPVVGVNQADAQAFCRWLTKKERREGRLASDQEYRLPTDAEWEAAVGKGEFPWGSQWPPPRGAGNYSDESAKRGRYKNWTIEKDWNITSGYDDGYDATAPVGTYTANRYGIHDLGGNVWERIGDRQKHVSRGASFNTAGFHRQQLASSTDNALGVRNFDIGFRVVCAVGSVR